MGYREKLAVFIKNYIDDHTMTQKQFAQSIGVSNGTISNYIQLKTEPELLSIFKMSLFTGIDVFEYMGLYSLSAHAETSEKIHRCKLLIDKIEKEVTMDFIKNDILATLVPNPKVNDDSIVHSEEELRTHFSAFVKSYLRTNGFTQQELADKLGVDRSNISDYIRGKTLPKVAVALKLCKAMNISIQELIGVKKDVPSSLDLLLKELKYIDEQLS